MSYLCLFSSHHQILNHFPQVSHLPWNRLIHTAHTPCNSARYLIGTSSSTWPKPERVHHKTVLSSVFGLGKWSLHSSSLSVGSKLGIIVVFCFVFFPQTLYYQVINRSSNPIGSTFKLHLEWNHFILPPPLLHCPRYHNKRCYLSYCNHLVRIHPAV